jgi:hypothetical protein
MAAGGFEKRHLLVAGTDGVDLDQLALGPVALDFDA